MVLISIDPFALRKAILVAIALLCFSVFCFADSLLMARQHGRVIRARTAHTSTEAADPVNSAATPLNALSAFPSWDVQLTLFPPAEAPFAGRQTGPFLNFGLASAE